METKIAVVDAGNRFVRWETKRQVHANHLFHRSAYVLVFDSRSRLLLQRRHPQKLTYAGHLDLSCCGHVESSDYPAGPDEQLDEVYRSVAQRELFEELGVKSALERLGHFGPEAGVHYEHLEMFRTRSDGPFKLQAEEVTEVFFASREELAVWIESAEAKITHSLRYFGQWLLMEDNPAWPR